METIKNYLDNMFAGLPKTQHVLDLKNNILTNMEEKYNELKKQGKSENEAIGIVISEFGNIDELVNELGIHKDEDVNYKPIVTKEEAENYLNVKRTMGIQVGIGVLLCILAPASLILFSQLFSDGIIGLGTSSDVGVIIGLISLFIFITIAVGMFIYSGMNFERYKYMEDGVQLPTQVKSELQKRYESFTPTFYLSIIVGVCLIVLSPVSIFVSSLIGGSATEYSVVVLIGIVAVAIFMFIATGTVRDGYSRLLGINEYTAVNRTYNEKEGKVIGAVASIVWPLAVLIFLFSGFAYNLWHIAWIVFPITGILFGMFSAVFSILTGKNE